MLKRTPGTAAGPASVSFLCRSDEVTLRCTLTKYCDAGAPPPAPPDGAAAPPGSSGTIDGSVA